MNIIPNLYKEIPPVHVTNPSRYYSAAARVLVQAGCLELAQAVLLRRMTLIEVARLLTHERQSGKAFDPQKQYAEGKLWDWAAHDKGK